MFRSQVVIVLFTIIWSLGMEDSCSLNLPRPPRSPPQQQRPPTKIEETRRSMGLKTLQVMFGGAVLWCRPGSAAHAACLPGDTSRECIGVFKVPLPMDNPPSKTTVSTNGGIGIPRSYDEAVQVLNTQRLATNDIMEVVQAGRLEEGGMKLLNLIPRLSTAGRLVIETAMSLSMTLQDPLAIRQMKELLLENALSDVLVGFSECDIMIGQGLRGEMGAITVAQVYILNELQTTSQAYDNFLVVAQKLAT